MFSAAGSEAKSVTFRKGVFVRKSQKHYTHRAGLSSRCPRDEITLDLDSLPIEVHGHQPGSAHNGHYHRRCFHPLLVSWEFGDLLGGKLREGNVHTSSDALDFILPYLEWASAPARAD